MSREIDERVLEMRFDNAQFEKNVQQSISTLDKLKEKLNLKDVGTGFDNLSKSAQKVNLSPIGKAVDDVKMKFSSLQVIGATALAKLTSSAMDAGKRMASAITQPLVEGGKTRALNIQQAKFQFEGLGIDVEKAMASANEAVKGTAYGLDSAAKIAGMFGASGMQAGEEMTRALRAVAGVAAMTGSSYEDIGNIFTTVAGQGRLMGDQLLQLSYRGINAAATLGKAMGKSEEQIRQMVSKNKISFQEFADAMDQAFGAHAKDANKLFTGALANAKAALSRIGADVASETFDDLRAILNSITPIIDTIHEEVKPFIREINGAVWNVTDSILKKSEKIKVALSDDSGWSQLETHLQGTGINIDKVATAFVDIARSHGVAVDEMIERNGSFKASLKEGWLTVDIFKETMQSFADTANVVGESTGDVSAKIEEFKGLADKVIKGSFGNGAKRMKALADAGYDYAQVQGMVNKVLKGEAIDISDLTDEQIKSIGYTEEQVAVMRDLAAQADQTGSSINNILTTMGKPSAISLVIDTLKNAFVGLVTIVKTFADAWRKTFSNSQTIYNIITAIHSLSEELVLSDETIDKLSRTFQGFTSLLKIASMFFGGAFSTALRVGNALLQHFDLNLLDLTASIGDAIVKFRQWLESSNAIPRAMNKIVDVLQKVVAVFGDLLHDIVELPAVKAVFQNLSKFISGCFTTIGRFFETIKGKLPVVINTLAKAFNTFVERIREQLPKIQNAFEKIKDFASETFEKIGDFFQRIGKKISEVVGNIVKAFKKFREPEKDVNTFAISVQKVKTSEKVLNSLKRVFSNISEFLTKAAHKIGDAFNFVKEKIGDFADYISGKVKLENVLAVGISGAFVLFLSRLGKAFTKLGDTFEAGKNVVDNFSNIFKGVADVFKASARQIKVECIFTITKALLALAAAVVVLARIDAGDAWRAVGILGTLAGGLIALMAAITLLGKIQTNKISVSGGSIFSTAASLLLIVVAIKQIQKLAEDGYSEVLKALGVLALIVGGLSAVSGLFARISNIGNSTAKNAKGAGKSVKEAAKSFKIGSSLIAMSVSLLLVVQALKQLANMKEGLGQALGALAIVGLIFSVLLNIASDADQAKVAGKGLFRMALAIGVVIKSARQLAAMSGGDIAKGLGNTLGILAVLTAVVAALSLLTGGGIKKLQGQNLTKAGTAMLEASAALLIVVHAIKNIADIDAGDIWKGIGAIAAIMSLFSIVVAASKYAGKYAAKAGLMILSMSGALIALSVVFGVLSILDPSGVDKATEAISSVLACFALIVAASGYAKFTKSAVKSLTVMTVALGVLAAALGILSIIDPAKLDSSKEALMGVMGMFAVLLAVSKYAEKVGDKIGPMLLAITALAGIIVAMSNLTDPKGALASATALSELLIALMASFKLLGREGRTKFDNDMLKNLASMLLAITALGAVISAVSHFTSPEGALASATALSEVILALSASFRLLGRDGRTNFDSSIIANLAVMEAALAGVAYIINRMAKFTPDTSAAIACATALSEAILSLSAALDLIALAGKGGMKANLVGLTSFGILITGLTGIFAGLGKLNELFPKGFGDNLTKGMEMFSQIGHAIGSFAGNIGSGFIDSLTGLENTEAIKEKLEGVKVIFDSFKELASVEGVNNFDFAGFGKGFKSLAKGLETLGESFGDTGFFGAKINADVLKDNVEAVSKIFTPLKKLASAGGAEDFDFKDFGKGFENLSKGLKTLGEAFGDKSIFGNAKIDPKVLEDNIKAVSKIIDPLKDLASADNVSDFNFKKFGKSLEGITEGLTTIATAFGGGLMGLHIDTETLEDNIDAVTKVFDPLRKLAATKGIEDFNFKKFGKGFRNVADGMIDIAKTLGDMTITGKRTIDTEQLGDSVDAISKLLEPITKMASAKGIADFNFKKFGDGFQNVAKGMKTLAKSLDDTDIDPKQLGDNLDAVSKIFGPLTEMMSIEGIEDFNFKKFGKGFGEMADGISEMTKILGDKTIFGHASIDTQAVSDSLGAVSGIITAISTLLATKGGEDFDFSDFGEGFKEMSNAMKTLSDDLDKSSIDTEALKNNITAVSEIFTPLKELISTKGIEDFKFGNFGTAFSQMATGLKDLGEALGDKSMSGKDKINSEALTDNIDAVLKIFGPLKELVSLKDIAKFDFSGFGKGFSDLSTALSTLGTSGLDSSMFDTESFKTNIEALTSVFEPLKTLASAEGLEDFDFSNFGAGFSSILQGMSEFSKDLDDSAFNTEAFEKNISSIAKVFTPLQEFAAVEGLEDFDFENFGKGLSSISNGLSKLGDSLGGKKIDAEKLGTNVTTMNTLFTSLKDLMTSFGTGETQFDFSSFGSNFVDISNALKDLGNSLGGTTINTEALSKNLGALKEIFTALKTLTSPTGMGEGEVGFDFSSIEPGISGITTQLTELGTKIADIDTEDLTANINAIKSIFSQFKELSIGGENGEGALDFSTLGTSLSSIGTALTTFATNLSGIDASTLQTNTNSIASVLSTIRSLYVGGEGEEGSFDFSTLESNFTALGSALSSITSKLTEVDTSTLQANVTAITGILDAIRNITADDDEGGVSFSSLQDNFTQLGNALSTLTATLSGLEVETISEKTGALKTALHDLSTLGSEEGGIDFSGFSSNINTISTSITGLVDTISNLQTENMSTGIQSIVDSLTSLNNVDTSKINTAAITVVTNFTNALNSSTGDITTAGQNMVSALVSALQSGDASGAGASLGASAASGAANSAPDFAAIGNNLVSSFTSAMQGGDASAAGASLSQSAASGAENASGDFTTAGTGFVNELVGALGAGTGPASSAGNSLGTSAASGAGNSTGSFQSTGAAMGQGLVNGLLSKLGAVRSAGAQLGAAAAAGTAAAAQVHSPSKVFIRIGEYLGEGLSIGIDHSQTDVASSSIALAQKAMSTIQNELQIHSPSKAFEAFGKYIGEGLAIGIRDSANLAVEEVRGTAEEIKNAAKSSFEDAEKWLNRKKDFDEITAEEELYFWQRVAEQQQEGTDEWWDAQKNAYDAYKQLLENKYQDSTSWIEREKNYNRLSQKEELAAYKRMQEQYVKGTEQREDADLKYYQLLHEMIDDNVDALDLYLQKLYSDLQVLQEGTEEYANTLKEIKYIEDTLKPNAQLDNADKWISFMDDFELWGDQQEKLAAYKRQLAYTTKGTEEWLNIQKQIYDLSNEIAQTDIPYAEKVLGLAKQRLDGCVKGTIEFQYAMQGVANAAKNLFEAKMADSENWLDIRDTFGWQNGLSEQLAAQLRIFTRVQEAYSKGLVSEEDLLEYRKNVWSAFKEISDAQEEYEENRKQLEEQAKKDREDAWKDYDDKIDEIEKEKQDKIDELEKEYEDALESRKDALYDAYGLFDEVSKKEEVSASALMQNLQDQIDEFEEWNTTLNTLSPRVDNEELMKELQEMGPSVLAELKALNSMSDEELSHYVDLWGEKHQDASDRATSELAGMRAETDAQIEQAKDAAIQASKEAKDALDEDLTEINNTLRTDLNELTNEYNETVGLLGTNVETEARETIETVLGILNDAGYNTAGLNAGAAFSTGFSDSIQEGVDKIINDIFGGLFTYTQQTVPENLDWLDIEVDEGFSSVSDTITEETDEANVNGSDNIGELTDNVVTDVAEMTDDVEEDINELVDGVDDAEQTLVSRTGTNLTAFKNEFDTKMPQITSMVIDYFTDMVDTMINTLTRYGDQFSETTWWKNALFVGDQIIDGIQSAEVVPYFSYMVGCMINTLTRYGFGDENSWYSYGAFVGSQIVSGLASAQDDVEDCMYGFISYTVDNLSDLSEDDYAYSPVISPVIDFDDTNRALAYLDDLVGMDRSMDLAYSLQNGSINSTNDVLERMGDMNAQSYNKIAGAIDDLRLDFNSLLTKVNNLQVVMSTGELVGAITPEMNRSLGNVATMNRRRSR